MPKIEVGQFSTLLRRYLGMKGVSDVVDELSPELSGALVLEAERPEWAFLKGERLCGWAQTVPALAANNSAVRFRNPATSGMVAVVTHIHVGASVGTSFTATFGAQAADQATVSGTGNRDGRQTPIGGALVASFGYAALGGNAVDGAIVAANSPGYPFLAGDSAYVITPGFALNIGLNTANVDLVIGIHWLEKRIDDLELR